MSIFILTVPGDYAQPIPADLTFPQGTTLQCTNISISDDAIVENDELFSVQLTSTDPAVILSPSARSATVTIGDDDSKSFSLCVSVPSQVNALCILHYIQSNFTSTVQPLIICLFVTFQEWLLISSKQHTL